MQLPQKVAEPLTDGTFGIGPTAGLSGIRRITCFDAAARFFLHG
jgi:hypothetical protein